MNYDIEDFLEMFNNGELEVEKYFNDYDTWFSILESRGLMGEIDPHNASDNDVWQNDYLLWLYENDREKYYKWVGNFLDDIQFDSQSGTTYWVGDREDLADLFCDGYRNDISQDTIRKILDGEGDAYEPYWDTTDDVYRDVIDELNPENIEHLKTRIIDELKGQQLSPETEEMELIASEQGHDEYWEMNSDVVTRIIDDEESMKSLLKDELSEMKSDLYSIHSNAYNSAYESTVWKEIWGELQEYFNGEGEWTSIPHQYKKDVVVEKYKIPIRNFEDTVNNYLVNNKGNGNRGTLEYHGSLLGIIKEDSDCLSARIPDYPDFREVDRNINLYFSDYF